MVHLLLHILTNGNYGVFRDELYYLDCSRHLDWGYVDHPPLSIWMLAGVHAVFGQSIHALRVLSELAGAAVIVVTALIAREMSGGRLAQVIAALAMAVAPGPMIISGSFSMNAFDMLFWAVLAWILVRLAVRDDPKLWLVFGAVAGLGLLNKISVLFLGFGVAVAIALTPLRRHLLSWQPYVGGALAAVISLPYLLWNAAHGWPTLEFMANARQYKIVAFSPLAFFGEQVLAMGPPLAPLWIGGLIWLMLPPSRGGGGRYRLLGWIFITVFILLVALKAKPYYLSAAFAMLFAAGGSALESLVGRLRKPAAYNLASGLVLFWVIASGFVAIPLAVPLLAPQGFLAYQATLGLVPKHAENNPVGEIPQYFSDRFGWENMASVVASVYEALPTPDKPATMIVGSNYGEAGAINYYGPDLGLPSAVSTHNSHYLWGPGPVEPEVMISIGGRRERLEELFEHVTHVATVTSTYAMPYESNLPIFVLRGLKIPLEEAWRTGKNFR
ncbi:MAG: ArnT family glycosyltransferase [Acidobacteriota bacterium]